MVAYALTFVTFVLSLRATWVTKALWALVLLPAFGKFIGFSVLTGGVFEPDLPEVLLWVWDWYFSGALILCLLSVPLVFFRFGAKAWLLPALAWGLAAWGICGGIRVPGVREVELPYAGLPAALDGYRIVHLSDVHSSCAARRWRTQAIVERANALRPDLVCLTGDYADGAVRKAFPFVEPLDGLRAKDGVVACTGNHEYSFDYRGWKKAYGRLENILFLDNACAFPRPQLAVAGVSDWKGWLDGHLARRPDPKAAFASATNGEFRVLLQHRPTDARENVGLFGVDLQLSGHTHGGIAPVLREIVGLGNGGFSRGLYSIGRAYLHVSPGAGQWIGCALRFCNPPEITLLTLRRAR